jgi:hypothetical protein
MELRYCHCIHDARGNSKNQRVLVPIEHMDRPITRYWMSPKQHTKLVELFQFTRNGYSSRDYAVYAVVEVLDDRERFVWAGAHSPASSDLPWLAERFGVAIPERLMHEHLQVEIPDNVDIHPDLLDDVPADGSPASGG